MVVSAAVVAGASVVGGAVQAKSAKDAAKTQSNAARDAAAMEAATAREVAAKREAAFGEAAGIQTDAITRASQEQLHGQEQVRDWGNKTAMQVGDVEREALKNSAQNLTNGAVLAQRELNAAVTSGNQARIEAAQQAAAAANAARDAAVVKFQASIDKANTAYDKATDVGQGFVTDARDQSNKVLKEEYDKGVAGFDPYTTAGKNAVNTMDAGLAAGGDFNRNFTAADFKKDGGYDFRLNEGTRALENSALSRGGLLSGDAMRGITEYGQGFASNELDKAYGRWSNDIGDRFTRLSDLAGKGLSATNSVAQLGQTYGQNVSTNNMAAGDKNANLEVGAAGWTGNNTVTGGRFAADQEIAKGQELAASLRNVGDYKHNTATTVGQNNANLAVDYSNIMSGMTLGQGQSDATKLGTIGTNWQNYHDNAAKIGSGGILAIGNAKSQGVTGATDAITTGLTNATGATAGGIRDAANATSAGQAASGQAWGNALTGAANTFTTLYSMNKLGKK